MDNHTARARHRRGAGASCAHADTVDHQIDRTVFRCLLTRIIASGDAYIVEHAAAKRIGLGDAWRSKALSGKHLRDKHTDGTAAKNDNPRIRRCAGTSRDFDDTHRRRCWLGQRRLQKAQMVGKYCQVGVGHHYLFGKSPRITHADQLARAAKMMIAAVTGRAVIAGHERHPLSCKRSGQRRANHIMPQNERWDPALVMAVPCMHVGPADPAEGQTDDALPTCGDRRLDITRLACIRTGIDKRLHFAVNHPSTIRACPVK